MQKAFSVLFQTLERCSIQIYAVQIISTSDSQFSKQRIRLIYFESFFVNLGSLFSCYIGNNGNQHEMDLHTWFVEIMY